MVIQNFISIVFCVFILYIYQSFQILLSNLIFPTKIMGELNEFSAAAELNLVVRNSILFCTTLPPRASECDKN